MRPTSHLRDAQRAGPFLLPGMPGSGLSTQLAAVEGQNSQGLAALDMFFISLLRLRR